MAALAKSIGPKNESQPEWLGFRGRMVGIYSLLVFLNLAAWIWAFMAFGGDPVLIGTAVLAYSLGRVSPGSPTAVGHLRPAAD